VVSTAGINDACIYQYRHGIYEARKKVPKRLEEPTATPRARFSRNVALGGAPGGAEALLFLQVAVFPQSLMRS